MYKYLATIVILLVILSACSKRSKVDSSLINEARVKPCKQPNYNWIPLTDECNPNYVQKNTKTAPAPIVLNPASSRPTNNTPSPNSFNQPNLQLPNVSQGFQDTTNSISKGFDGATGGIQKDFKYTYDALPTQKEVGRSIDRNLGGLGVPNPAQVGR